MIPGQGTKIPHALGQQSRCAAPRGLWATVEDRHTATKTRYSQNLINIKKEEEVHLCMTLRVTQVNVCCESARVCVCVWPSVYMCVFFCIPSVPSSPPLSLPPGFFTYCMSLECMLGSVCEWLGSGHCRPTGSAEQSLGVGEKGGLQLLLPLLQPHSPRGESSAGLLPSGCMNISYAGALSWPSTSVFAPPVWEGAAPFCLAGIPKAEPGVGRSRAGRGPLAWGAMAGCVEGRG